MERARDGAATRRDRPIPHDPPTVIICANTPALARVLRLLARRGGKGMDRHRGRLRQRPGRRIDAAPTAATTRDEYDDLLARSLAEQQEHSERARNKRRNLWDELLSIFRHRRPVEDELTEVSTIAEVAIDQVFSAHKLSEQQQIERHGDVKDYAECAALYGYVLGYQRAREERAA